jgi:GT2 family glycosyltransferase
MQRLALSIVIVSYGTRELTVKAIESVMRETHDVSFEVIVVDNASTDGSADAIAAAFPAVRLIRSKVNLGFGRACNLAAAVAEGDALLLLNPDTVVLNRAIDRLSSFLESDPTIGIAGGGTLFADGSLNPKCAWGRPTAWRTLCQVAGLSRLLRGIRAFDSEGIESWRRNTVRDVEIVSGCFLLIRRSLWDRLGGFDPRFVMYGEDADLCIRAKQAGYRCVANPAVTIVHHAGASERDEGARTVKLFAARVSLLRKHSSSVQAGLGQALLLAWAGSRVALHGVLRFVRPGSAAAYRAWGAVWRRRRDWLAGMSETLATGAQPSLDSTHAS